MKRIILLFIANILILQYSLATVSVWDGSSSDISWYKDGIKEFHIKSAAQLKGLADIVNNDLHNFESEIILLDEDIDFNRFPWTPIGLSKDYDVNNGYHPFKGVFDGGDHTIKNVMLNLSTIDVHNYPIVGLFGFVKGGKLKNLNLQGEIDISPNIVGTKICVGGLVGKVVDGEIEHISADFNISDNIGANLCLGVVAGSANHISKVKAQGNINDANHRYSSGEIGGVAGYSETISEADSKVSIYIRTFATSGPTYIGGVVGSSYTIKDVIFTGSNYNHNYGASTNQLLLVGGICANLNNGTVSNAICYSYQNYASSDRNINNVFIGSIIPNSYIQYTSVKNCYYSLNSTFVANGGIGVGNQLGIGVEGGTFFTGEPLKGFDTNIWLFKKDNLPELKAFLPVVKYTLTYYVDGKVFKEYQLKEGEPITPETAPSKEGYTFSGWTWIPSEMPAEDVTITGSFIPNKHSLTYLVDGEVYKSYMVDFDFPLTIETEPTKEGYTFSGWSEIPETMPDYDVTVTGTFIINKYKLTYMIDGEKYKSYEIEYGEAITPEAEPTKEGYTFSGWSWIPQKMPAEDVTITGSFIPNKYKLTYMVDGEVYQSYEVPYGSTINPEAEPKKEGYTFSGWSFIPSKMPAEDVTVSGRFTINSYKLTYMIDDQVYKEIMVEYGAVIKPEPQPEGDYVHFEWVGLPEKMPANDVTVYASYETGIIEALVLESVKAIYAPNGKKLDKPQKGLNIIIMSDGKVRKLVIK